MDGDLNVDDATALSQERDEIRRRCREREELRREREDVDDCEAGSVIVPDAGGMDSSHTRDGTQSHKQRPIFGVDSGFMETAYDITIVATL